MLKKIKLIFNVHTIGLINASIYNIKFILTHHSQVIIIYNLIIHNLQVYVRISQSYLYSQLTNRCKSGTQSLSSWSISLSRNNDAIFSFTLVLYFV